MLLAGLYRLLGGTCFFEGCSLLSPSLGYDLLGARSQVLQYAGLGRNFRLRCYRLYSARLGGRLGDRLGLGYFGRPNLGSALYGLYSYGWRLLADRLGG
jgi:hypothetical protein